MLGADRAGTDWSVASSSGEGGWMVELRINKASLPAPSLALRTYNDRPHGWWSWPSPPAGTAAARVERFPRLWIPLQLGPGICAGAGTETDALLVEVREWVTPGRRDPAFGSLSIRPEDVVPESSEPVCRNLAEAYAKLPGEVFTPESVNVVRVGKGHFAMFDPNVMAGQARSVMIFDSTFVLKKSRQINLRSPR